MATGQRQVNVFFPKPSEKTPPPENPFELSPVIRFANPQTPARGALEALLGNITIDEESQGFFSLDTSNLSIGILTIENFQATVDFFSGGTKTWLGGLSPATFKQAVEFTLKQFSSVRKAVIMVDGDPDFDSGQ